MMGTSALLRVCVVSLVLYVTCGFVVPDTDTAGDFQISAGDKTSFNKTLGEDVMEECETEECEVVNILEREQLARISRESRGSGARERRSRPKRGFRVRFRRRRGGGGFGGWFTTQRIRQCQATCWGAWQPFGACSVQCGSSGRQYSTRARSVSAQCAGIINSHGCPGPSTRSQACSAPCQNGGTLGSTSCRCPAGFKGACCQTRVTCGFPGKPTNGAVSNAASTHNYNSRVTYSCSTGYTLRGAGSNQCLVSGQWQHTAPSCTRVTCTKPAVNAHVSITPSRGSYDYGSRVVYGCPEGYTRQGADSTQCQGSWTNPSPTCVAITCSAISAPAHGSVRTSSGVTFRSVATFSCNDGYHLSGSRSRTCQISGQWDGTTPTCARVTCPRLSSPGNGAVTQPSSAGKGSAATYSCNSGYELRGNQRRTCNYGNSATGSWSGSTPSCSAVSCGAPPAPAHGTRSGTTFTLGSRVSFRCEAGHYLVGAHEATCQANKRWSHSGTRCNPCVQNQYKETNPRETPNAARVCTACPSNSHTTSTASTTRTQCVCNHGYQGSNGGPCSIIKCPALVAPPHGLVGACARNFQNTCTVTCAQGYIRHGGDETRTCLLNKRWSGTPPTCTACPKNTYKSGGSECANCPVNSATVGEASSRTDCVCKSGFSGQPGQKCTDINECASGNGGCEQICTNLPGTFRCECRSGFVQDSSDNKKCVAKNSCPALDRPAFGGLVCLSQVSIHTERCSVKCNAGYQHIIRSNQVEECGPSTNFRWTTEANQTPILGCIESFFDEIFLDGEAAYFTTSCDRVTGSVLQEVQQAFVRMLKQRGVCTGVATCSVDDVTVACGAQSRRKRGVTSGGNEITIKFKVKVPSESKVSSGCASRCDATRDVILFDECYAACEAEVERERQEKLAEAKSRLNGGALVESGRSDDERLASTQGVQARPQGRPQIPSRTSNMFVSGGLLSRPVGVAAVSDIRASCDAGMERRNNTCVPCGPGSYLRAASGSGQSASCVLCAPGQYQPRSRATTCIRCEDGKHSPRGATSCTHAPTEEPIDFFVVIKPQAQP